MTDLAIRRTSAQTTVMRERTCLIEQICQDNVEICINIYARSTRGHNCLLLLLRLVLRRRGTCCRLHHSWIPSNLQVLKRCGHGEDVEGTGGKDLNLDGGLAHMDHLGRLLLDRASGVSPTGPICRRRNSSSSDVPRRAVSPTANKILTRVSLQY